MTYMEKLKEALPKAMNFEELIATYCPGELLGEDEPYLQDGCPKRGVLFGGHMNCDLCWKQTFEEESDNDRDKQ